MRCACVAVAESNRAQIAINGGISTVLVAMRTFPKDINTQHFGARAVMNLAFKSGACAVFPLPLLALCRVRLSPLLRMGGADTNRTQIVSAGGTSVVINAMQQFHEDAGVQGFGCGALANLAHNDGSFPPHDLSSAVGAFWA